MAAEEWEIDAARSNVGFTVRHMVISKVRGRFTRWRGTLALDWTELSASKVAVTIDVASIDTRDGPRDGYLRSADFFDVEKHPAIAFRSTRIEEVDAKKYRVRGDLTIRGVQGEVVLDAVLGGQGKAAAGASPAHFRATTQIDRKDFGLQWGAALETGGFLVGDIVDVAVEVEAKKVGGR